MSVTLLFLSLSSAARAAEPVTTTDDLLEDVRPVVLLQTWGTLWDQDEDEQADSAGYGDPEPDAGMSVKRIRLGFEGERGRFDYRLTLGMTAPFDPLVTYNANLGIIDGYVAFRQSGGFVEVGRGRVPFSRDQMMGAGELTFQERGFGAEHIAPGRALGVRGGYQAKGLEVQGGVYNSGAGEGILGDDNDGKTVVARVEWANNDASYRTYGKGKGLTVGVGGGGFYTADVATTTTAAGADALVRYSGVYLLADAAWAKLEPGDGTVATPGVWAETTRLALTGQLGANLGRWEPAVRWTTFDDSASGLYQQGLAGVTWHGGEKTEEGRDSVRLGGGYVLRLEPGDVTNDSVRVWTQVRY